MRLCLIICGAVLAGCGPKAVPVELVTPCPGWQGATPATEGELIRAALAERAGRECANGKLEAVGRIVGGGS